jgi:hypothetical protein
MKICFQALYSSGAYWKIKYNNGNVGYVIGMDNLKLIIEDTKEKITIENSLGFDEHSQLIKLLKNKKTKTQQPK